MIISNIEIACKDAEHCYNECVKLLMTDCNDENDARLEYFMNYYECTLDELREYGLGGVRINGTFRNLNQEGN